MSVSLPVSLVQLDTAWHDPARNLVRAESFVAEAARQGARVVVLPELFTTGFTMQVAPFAETLPGPTTETVSLWARRFGVFVVATVAEQGTPLPRNAAFVVSPDGALIATYRKLHPFSFGDENRHYAPGSELCVFEVDDVRCALQICYDLRFPETFRALSDRGVECCFVVANWPTRRAAHWSALLVARAIENQMAVCGVNRVGSDPNVAYGGASAIVSEQGEGLACGGPSEGLVSATLDIDRLRAWRRDFPALRDRRRDLPW
jgi:predicted amidohydrolase